MTPTMRSPAGTVDDLDNRLTAFFEAEMPKPWPTLRLPFPSGRLARRHRWLPPLRSRLALAASVALLIGGAMLLGSPFQNAKQPAGIRGLNDGSAKYGPLGKVKTELIQSMDGPTLIRITIDDDSAPR